MASSRRSRRAISSGSFQSLTGHLRHESWFDLDCRSRPLPAQGTSRALARRPPRADGLTAVARPPDNGPRQLVAEGAKGRIMGVVATRGHRRTKVAGLVAGLVLAVGATGLA